jgi:hypothetical protein
MLAGYSAVRHSGASNPDLCRDSGSFLIMFTITRTGEDTPTGEGVDDPHAAVGYPAYICIITATTPRPKGLRVPASLIPHQMERFYVGAGQTLPMYWEWNL